MPTTDQLPSKSDFVQAGENSLRVDLDPSGTGKIDLTDGSRLTAQISCVAQMLLRGEASLTKIAKARSVDSAVGEDLDEIARLDYGTSRLTASFSVGVVYMQRTGVAATSIPAGSRVGVPGGSGQPSIDYTFNDDVPVAANVATVALNVTASEVGGQGNVQLSAVTKIVDQLPDTTWALYVPVGGDPLLNGAAAPLAFGGGSLIETDDELRARLKAVSTDASKQKGTKAAVDFGARQVPGVRFVDSFEPGDGSVVLFVGDANYGLPAALLTAVLAELDNWRTDGVVVYVRPYNVIVVQVTATLYMNRPVFNYNASALVAAAIALVQRYFGGRQPPDEVLVNAVRSAILAADGDTQDCLLTSPSVDILRKQSASYSSTLTLNRYVTNATSIAITLAGPRTQ